MGDSVASPLAELPTAQKFCLEVPRGRHTPTNSVHVGALGRATRVSEAWTQPQRPPACEREPHYLLRWSVSWVRNEGRERGHHRPEPGTH